MEVFRLFGSIFIDSDKADESMKKTEKNAEGIASKLGSGIKTAAKWGTAIVGVGTAVGGAVAGALVSVSESTREYREEMAKLDTAFQDQQHSSEAAKNTYKELQMVLGDTAQAVEASNHLAMLCSSEQELQQWTDICTGVYAKFGDSIPIEGLAEAANETAKTGSLTGSLADALNWAGINEDEFNASLEKCSSEQERQQLIMETLTGVYGEAAAAYKENNKDILEANASQEKMNETMAKFGAMAEPIVSKGKTMFAELLMAMMPIAMTLVEDVLPPFAELVTLLLDILVPAIQLVGGIVGGVLGDALNMVVKFADKIIGVLEGIGLFLKGVFTLNFEEAFLGICQIVYNAFAGLVDIVYSPINAIIGLINGFIEGLNAIKIPDWVPGVGGTNLNISKLPLLSLPALWEGGNVVDSGSVLVGEKGPEILDLPKGARVTPLDKYEKQRNTNYSDLLLIIKQAIIMALKSVKLQEIVEIVPDERGLFKVIVKEARNYENRTGKPAF